MIENIRERFDLVQQPLLRNRKRDNGCRISFDPTTKFSISRFACQNMFSNAELSNKIGCISIPPNQKVLYRSYCVRMENYSMISKVSNHSVCGVIFNSHNNERAKRPCRISERPGTLERNPLAQDLKEATRNTKRLLIIVWSHSRKQINVQYARARTASCETMFSSASLQSKSSDWKQKLAGATLLTFFLERRTSPTGMFHAIPSSH